MVAYYDPKSKKAVGIYCDLCNSILTNKFEYFNVTFDLVEVDSSVQKSGPKEVNEKFINLDVCRKCYDELKARVLVNITEREKKPKSKWTTKT